ncbi:hypothetical protein MAH1_21500 [Sessilibacter sp. MAH1]
MNELELKVIEYLSRFSIVAEKIHESNNKTPDFLINQEEKILIELKEKIDQDELYEKKKKY